MALDIPTLLAMAAFTASLLALLMFTAWLQDRTLSALGLWSAAYAVGAVGVSLLAMRAIVGAHVSITIGNAVVLLAIALGWTSARNFERRPAIPWAVAAGPLVWLVACNIPSFYETVAARVILASSMMAAYTYLTAFEFWRGRAEALSSRWPAVALPCCHGSVFLLRAIVAHNVPFPVGAAVASSGWYAVMVLEGMVYLIASAFLLLSLVKERAELEQRRAARADPLTGLANRRAFLEEAEKLVKEAGRHQAPVTLLLFDLDRFKQINDRHGHGAGDRVLCRFAETGATVLRRCDLFGRIGGEEFAALLPGATPEEALAVAERLRTAFATACFVVDGVVLGATVSVGLCGTGGAPALFPALLESADRALYQAKSGGRDRVCPAFLLVEAAAA